MPWAAKYGPSTRKSPPMAILPGVEFFWSLRRNPLRQASANGVDELSQDCGHEVTLVNNALILETRNPTSLVNVIVHAMARQTIRTARRRCSIACGLPPRARSSTGVNAAARCWYSGVYSSGMLDIILVPLAFDADVAPADFLPVHVPLRSQVACQQPFPDTEG